MAVDTTLKSVEISNREATPRTLVNPGEGAPAVKKFVKSYLASVTAALSITSVIRMVQVPAHCHLTDLNLQSAAQTAGAFDIGLYRTNADGGAVVDQDMFATAVSCASAVPVTNVLNESTGYTIAEQNQPLWQAAGMTEPAKGTMLDIALTVATTDVTTGTGAIALEAGYID